MTVSDFLLLIGSVVIWMALMLLSTFWAVWMTPVIVVLVVWLVVKNLEDE